MPALSARSGALGLVLSIVLGIQGASAQAPGAAAELLAAALGAAGAGAVAYDDAVTDGGSVTLSRLSLTLPDGSVATIPSLVLSGIVSRESGGFVAARMDFDNGGISGADRTVTWATAALEDVVVPTAEEVKTRPKIRPFRTFSATTVAVSGAGLAAPVEIASIGGEIGDMVDDGAPADFRARATGVRLPIALFANSVVGVIVGMLDYPEFLADVSLDGVYDTTGNTASVDALTVDVPSVGKLALAARASSFSIRAITNPDPEVSKAARAEARLDSLRLRIENEGFVERVLDMQAAMLGGTRDDVRAQIVDGALPFALSFIKNEAFRTEFRTAVGAFLADPRTLTITVEPEEPMPLGQVARAITRAPMTVPDLLAPKVEANN